MIDRLIDTLVQSKNEAADDVLLEAVRLGNERERLIAFEALLRRKTVRGLGGLIGRYEQLDEALQGEILKNIAQMHPVLRECGRNADLNLRLAAMKLIALGRQGRLAHVILENLHDANDIPAKAAVEAMVALARWVSTETRALQRGPEQSLVHGARGREPMDGDPKASSPTPCAEAFSTLHAQLMENRPEIEAAVARAMDVHRGRHGQDLLRAALLLADWPGSRTLAILRTTKHGGQSPMVRRLQQPPASEHAEAFLLGASHGQLRSHFGIVFSHINEAPVLDALLRKTHWLKDQQLRLCIHQVTRGVWWSDSDLQHDIERRTPCDAARIAEWLAASGMHDVLQDERMARLKAHAGDDFDARLRLFRIAARRRQGASAALLRDFLNDPDERLMRMAAREILRRRPTDYENMLLQLMTAAPESVRRVISRSIGQAGFEQYWQRFDRLDRETRRQAGRAMLKILPDAASRLARRLASGPVEQRLKAMQMAQELQLVASMRQTLLELTQHPNAKVRSKAVTMLGELPGPAPDSLLERVLNDADARVRSNAIEVLESRHREDFLPLLAQRARSANNRERANAIKAMNKMRVGVANTQLAVMLRDQRSEHRISALWTLRKIGWWRLLHEVGRLAKEDGNLRVRRYALSVLRDVAAQLGYTEQAV